MVRLSLVGSWPLVLALALAGCRAGRAAPGCRCHNDLELDHIFVFVSKDAPEREGLIRLGLRPPDHVARHTGQGTASVGFVFENAYLELLWVEDEAEFAATCAADGIDEFCQRARWRESGASPFGIGLRNRCGQDHPPPLPYRELRGEWMKPDSCIYIIDAGAGPGEPEFFVVPGYMALPAWVNEVDTAHPLGVHRVTGAEVTVSSRSRGVCDFGAGSGFNFVSASSRERLSRTARQIGRWAEVHFRRGAVPLLTLTFDNARQGKFEDFRPGLPLVIEY